MRKIMMLAAMLAMVLVAAAPAFAQDSGGDATSTTGDATSTTDNSVSIQVTTVDTNINSNFEQGQFVGGDLIIGDGGTNSVVSQSVFLFGHPFFFVF